VPPTFGKPRLEGGKLKINVADDLSGISKWEGRCGGRWMRLAFEKGVLHYPIEDDILEAGQEVRIWAVDGTGNLGHQTFQWPLE